MRTWPTCCAWAPIAPGTDPAVDEAVALGPRIEAMLRQDRAEHSGMQDAFARLREALGARPEGGHRPMARDPCRCCCALRRLQQDAARRELAEGVRPKPPPRLAWRTIDARLAREADALASLDDALLRAAYPAWLAACSVRPFDAAQAMLAAATERTGALRVQLADARASTRVVMRRCWRGMKPHGRRRRGDRSSVCWMKRDSGGAMAGDDRQ